MVRERERIVWWGGIHGDKIKWVRVGLLVHDAKENQFV
jgi:hypothetical protein